jgi:hypothetical protein
METKEKIERYKKLLNAQVWPKDVEETLLKIISELEAQTKKKVA